MLCILKKERRSQGTDKERMWCYCYCDIYKKWGWIRESMIVRGASTTGVKFPIQDFSKELGLENYLAQYSWRLNENGYLRTTYKKKNIMQHRLVIEVICKKTIPSDLYVDHIDGNKINNHPNNLRIFFQWENDSYRSSQLERVGDNNLPRGVYKRKIGPHYRAKFRGKNIGNIYKNAESAFAARIKAEQKFYEDNKDLVQIKEFFNSQLDALYPLPSNQKRGEI